MAFWVFCMALSFRAGRIAYLAGSWDHGGFATYYTAGKLLLEGRDPALNFDPIYFQNQLDRIAPPTRDIWINPPALNVFLAPFCWLPLQTAKTIWNLSGLALYLGVLFGWARSQGLKKISTPALLIPMLWFYPLYLNLDVGQVYVWMAALLFLTTWAYLHKKNALCGIGLSLLLMTKIIGLFAIPLLIVQKRWAVLKAFGITSLAIGLLSLPLFGWESWLEVGKILFGAGQMESSGAIAYQNLPALIHHVLVRDPFWSPHAWFHHPHLVRPINLIVVTLLLGVILLSAYRKPFAVRDWLLVFSLGLLLSPYSLDYHYLLFVPIWANLWSALKADTPTTIRILLIGCLAMIAWPWPKQPLDYAGFLPLAYPHLIGLLGFMAICAFQKSSLKPDAAI
ncbi:MAG: DUF2029 domain-containing protein [Acidobacteria bacterium]|nr:DUF2029 domain-containing protein [Acidobacteriota bacterium]